MFYINNLLYKMDKKIKPSFVTSTTPLPSAQISQQPTIEIARPGDIGYIPRNDLNDALKMSLLGKNVMKVVKTANFWDVLFYSWSWKSIVLFLVFLFICAGIMKSVELFWLYIICSIIGFFLLRVSFYMIRLYAMYIVRSFFYYNKAQ